MKSNLIISQSIAVNASVEKVWKALTDPTIIKDYLYGTETVTDWKVGSEIIFKGEWEGKEYRDHGVILEFEKFRKISYSYWSAFSGVEDKSENYSTVSYTIKPIDTNQTELTWTQKGYATEAGYEHSKNGMTEFLESIKAVMER